MSAALLASARALLAACPPVDGSRAAMRSDFEVAFTAATAPLFREDGPTHATASSFAFDRELEHVLLVFHRKGRFWVQPGGHLEHHDDSILGAAARELGEETGLGAELAGDPVATDLDHHALAASFGTCRSHLDFGVAFVLDERTIPMVSDESEDVMWWPVAALPSGMAPGLDRRIRGILDRMERPHADA